MHSSSFISWRADFVFFDLGGSSLPFSSHVWAALSSGWHPSHSRLLEVDGLQGPFELKPFSESMIHTE